MADSEIEIIRYQPEHKKLWNDFVESSKNGTFLLNRGYMDYHSDRFSDTSLIINRDGKPYCLLPANIQESTVFSHQGLTYGGLVMSDKCKAEGILQVFKNLLEFFRDQGIREWIYKPMPHIYHKIPSEEDLYALFRCNASLIARNISSSLDIFHRVGFNKNRKQAERRSKKAGIVVKLTKDYDIFWEILTENLDKTYGASPVHSKEEMKNLAHNFPENIKLIGAWKENKMVGGIVCYISPTTIHTQYISASQEGKKVGAIDAIIAEIISNMEDTKNCEKTMKWLDFGTSNEDGGRYLNESLIYQKEGFGGRGICYDTYKIIP